MKLLTVQPRTNLGSDNIIWTPPGDKSISQRSTILTSLATGTSRISGLLWSEDTVNNLRALLQLGIKVEVADNSDILVHGRGLRGLNSATGKINVGNSATSARLMLAILCGHSGTVEVDGNGVLRRRPMGWIVEPLREMGASLEWRGDLGCLPVRVTGAQLSGLEHYARVASAQAVSALLYAGLLAEGPTRIYRRAVARDHTERLFRYFGIEVLEEENFVQVTPPGEIEAKNISIPGDISSAAFPIVLVAMHPEPGLTLNIQNVGLNPTRIGILTVLKEMGANIAVQERGIVCGEPVGDITVTSGNSLRGTIISGASFVQSLIDEIPLLAALAATADGETHFKDASELCDKDTNRIATTCELLQSFGIESRLTEDGFIVYPGILRSPGVVSVPNDHRIAMTAMALASRCSEPTSIENWKVVQISFPTCLEALRIVADVHIDSEPEQWGPQMLAEVGIRV